MRIAHRFLTILFPFCPEPFYALTVTVDGHVILCCHLWDHSVVVGDLKRQSLGEIWNGEAINRCRAALQRGQGRDIPSCAKCSLRRGTWSR